MDTSEKSPSISLCRGHRAGIELVRPKAVEVGLFVTPAPTWLGWFNNVKKNRLGCGDSIIGDVSVMVRIFQVDLGTLLKQKKEKRKRRLMLSVSTFISSKPPHAIFMRVCISSDDR